MKTVAYTCDRCDKVILEKEQIWNVAVVAECEPRVPDKSIHSWTEHKAQWCRECMERVGMVCLSKLKQDPPTDPKTEDVTLEDIIRRMIADEVG